MSFHCFRSVLAPHAGQILHQMEDLLPLDPTPEPPPGSLVPPGSGCNGSSCNGKDALPSVGGHTRLLTITEQSFLYESSAHLILARPDKPASGDTVGGGDEGSGSASQLFTMLLRPILLQFADLVQLLAKEPDDAVAEQRGNVVKQAADLIT